VLDDLEPCRHAVAVIGHCRWATHGDPQDNRNNHPHPAGRGWLVHNGVIRNDQALLHQDKLRPRTDCDSEVLGLLMIRSLGRSWNGLPGPSIRRKAPWPCLPSGKILCA
jgi:glucosamine 6-phosphate synthetase-like amidotransferase/phosphosugar isomerase protein